MNCEGNNITVSFWECSWMWLDLPVVILGISVLEFVNSDLNLKTATSLERSCRMSFQCQDGDGEWYLLSNSMRFFACNILNLCYLKLIIVDELDKELAPLFRNLIKVAQNTLITPHPTLCSTWSWTLEIHAAIERPSFTASRKVTRACRSRIIGTRLLDLIG